MTAARRGASTSSASARAGTTFRAADSPASSAPRRTYTAADRLIQVVWQRATRWVARSDPMVRRATNPPNEDMFEAIVGNGQGYSTEKPALGFPAGGLGPDNRIGLYIGDSWKILPNLTISPGLRCVRDTGRTDSDLPAIPELNAAFPGLRQPGQQSQQELCSAIGYRVGSRQEWQDSHPCRRRAVLRERDFQQRSV